MTTTTTTYSAAELRVLRADADRVRSQQRKPRTRKPAAK